MNTARLFLSIAIASLLSALPACATGSRSDTDAVAIANEINELAADDQRLDQLVINSDPQIKEPGFFDRKRELQIERTARIKQIYNDIGFPAPSEFDAKASSNFWLLVQHSDNDPVFQQQVLDAMDELPESVVSSSEKAYLVDRVRINTDRPQLYGTQVLYDFDQARAYPKPTEDPAGVDERRSAVGLEPLWQYMNGMSKLNHTMNRAMYQDKGVMQPWQYPEGYSGW